MTKSAAAIRQAEMSDLQPIVELLADDLIGRTREDNRLPLAESYGTAFRAIETDPNQILAVAERGDRIVAVLQLTFIPGLARKGAWRGQIESVRVV